MIIKKKKLNDGTNSQEPIVDVEISNDISNNGREWKYEESDIISFAVLMGNEARVLLREADDDKEDFKDAIKRELYRVSQQKGKKSYSAFNYKMEQGAFKGFLRNNYYIKEIKPFKGKGFSKQKFYEILLEDNLLEDVEIPNDPLEKDSGEVLDRYEKEDYLSIITHNLVDVIKQYQIFKNKDYLYNKYKEKINSQGWYNG